MAEHAESLLSNPTERNVPNAICNPGLIRKTPSEEREDFLDSAMDKLQAAHDELAEMSEASTSAGAQIKRRLNVVLSQLEDSLIILRLAQPR